MCICVIRITHLRKPIKPLPENVEVSPRVAPSVFGLGLLEAIPEETILAYADENDVDGDGISGRPNYVWDVVAQRYTLGRFGWKANQPTLFATGCSSISRRTWVSNYIPVHD